MVMNSAAKMAGLQKGNDDVAHRYPLRRAEIKRPPRSEGSICERRKRMIAIAKGAHITTWAMITEWTPPDRPTRWRETPAWRSPRMTTGIVGGSNARAR